MTVFVSAGEASGDAYGAALVQEMRRLSPAPFRAVAIGGRRLGEACDAMVADSTRWGAISITQTLKIVPLVLAGLPGVLRQLGNFHGDSALAIPIDFGFFNSRFACEAKRRGWKVLAFIPPGSWRHDRQAPWAPRIYDAVSTPFTWSAEILTQMGTPDVHWFGHPLKQLLRDKIATSSGKDRLDQVAVMPGSRRHEISHNLPMIAEALPTLPAEFALAPGTDVPKFLRTWQALAPGRNDRVTTGDSASVLLRSRAAVVCSGTATLEAALCRCPMTVVYRGSRAMHLEAKLIGFKIPKFVSLPNILLDRSLVDEFVSHAATAENVGPNLAAVLADGQKRQNQLAGFEELDALLGPDDAITQTALLALEMLGHSVNPSST